MAMSMCYSDRKGAELQGSYAAMVTRLKEAVTKEIVFESCSSCQTGPREPCRCTPQSNMKALELSRPRGLIDAGKVKLPCMRQEITKTSTEHKLKKTETDHATDWLVGF